MARVGNLALAALTALMLICISFSEVEAQYKEFSFNKDIQVVPDNGKSLYEDQHKPFGGQGEDQAG